MYTTQHTHDMNVEGLCYSDINVVILLLTDILIEHRQATYVHIYIYNCIHIKLT